MSQPNPPNRYILGAGLLFIAIGYNHTIFMIVLGGLLFAIALFRGRASLDAQIFRKTWLGLVGGMGLGAALGLLLPIITAPIAVTLPSIVIGAIAGPIALFLFVMLSPIGIVISIAQFIAKLQGQIELNLPPQLLLALGSITAFGGAVMGAIVLSPAMTILLEPIGGEMFIMGLAGMMLGTEWGYSLDNPRKSTRFRRFIRYVRALRPTNKMNTLPASLVVEPFSKINYWPLPKGGKRLRVYLLMERPIEGAQTGVALDGSASMQGVFGRLLLGTPSAQETENYKQRGMIDNVDQDGRIYQVWSHEAVTELINRGIFRYTDNLVEPQARAMTAYLSKFDADGGTTVIYWATGDGRQIEVVGDLTGQQCANYTFKGPGKLGNSTHLLPAVRYFVERFREARWGIYVFITDGKIDDLEEVKAYCINLARDIEQKKRHDLKLVLIGVGEEVDEEQMEELDNLETGTQVDLWDHKLAKEMKQLAEIFAEVVSESVIIVPNDGVIRDEQKNIIKDYRDSGLPALLLFDLPPHCRAFTLEVGGQVISQKLE